MKVLLFLARGVELIEASVFIDVFGWHRHYCNGNIEVITCGLNRDINSTFNIPLKVDLLLEEVEVKEFDALAIPGGFEIYGFYEDAYNKKFLEIIRQFNELKKPIASVCVGALPIGKTGILKGKKGTTYHLLDKKRQKQLKEFGVNVIDEPIIIEKNIITSWCPSTAIEVALKLLEMLTSLDDSNKVRELMGY